MISNILPSELTLPILVTFFGMPLLIAVLLFIIIILLAKRR